MDIKEKRKAVKEYCAGREYCWAHEGREECPLYGDEFDECCDGNDVEINKAFWALFGGEKEQVQDNVNHPAHYQGKHECIDEMIALFGYEDVKGFCRCNVYKYRYRAAMKNGQEDLDKADWYMDKLMELEQKGATRWKLESILRKLNLIE